MVSQARGWRPAPRHFSSVVSLGLPLDEGGYLDALGGDLDVDGAVGMGVEDSAAECAVGGLDFGKTPTSVATEDDPTRHGPRGQFR